MVLTTQDIRAKQLCECDITIRTCAQLYKQWRSRSRVYKKAANKGGILMHINYLDTGVYMEPQQRMMAPIVLAVHGAPGSYEDFNFISEHLRTHNVRVIAPNFPVMSETVRTIFRHSADEKAAYLIDFLRAIQVYSVDLLISHSSAIFPSLLLINTTNSINIRSLALFNPAGHRLPHSMKPAWFKCGSVKFYHRKPGRVLFKIFGPQFLKMLGTPVKVDNMDDVMLSATVMKNSHCRRVEEQLHNLNRMKLPTLLLFSENDKLIEKEIFYEMANFLDVSSDHFDYYDCSGILERSGFSNEHWIRVIVFKAGGHYSYLNYGHIVKQAIESMLRRVCQNNNNNQIAPAEENKNST